jgi:FkbM family methyltransferase
MLSMVEKILGRFIPLTRVRILVASILRRLLAPFLRNSFIQVNRNGINYSLDCNEGIDFSLLLFGHYQNHLFPKDARKIEKNDIIIDVGANLGAMTLNFAKLLKGGNGHVHAFEPSDFAYNKLLKNLELNPDLKDHISPYQSFVSHDGGTKPDEVYASWPIGGEVAPTHNVHGGSLKTIKSSSVITIDNFMKSNSLDKLSMIKIDTDGFELDVLKGARKSLENFKPCIIFEAGLYLMEHNKYLPEDIRAILEPLGYLVYNLKTGKAVSWQNFKNEVPRKTTTDFWAQP